jgi:SAM-dependent methyltransferase
MFLHMDAKQYDGWYQTPRGRWIGNREIELLVGALKPRPGESLLDVGCGTGFFTREMAGRFNGKVMGIDINKKWVQYACQNDISRACYAVADALRLPFKNKSFDLVISVAALCFVSDMHKAIGEILRVTRRSFAVGLLNRNSLLWLQKGKKGGRGAYSGARWHTVEEVRSMVDKFPVKNVFVKTAVHMPSGGLIAQHIERLLPSSFFTGAFILVKADV